MSSIVITETRGGVALDSIVVGTSISTYGIVSPASTIIRGADGSGGSGGVQNVFIGATAPTGTLPDTYLWIDTSEGNIGLWVENGL